MKHLSKSAIFAGPNVVPFPRRGESPAFEVKAKADDTADVMIYGVIGDDWFEESVTAKEFADQLKKVASAKTLNIYINSPGGSVFDGVAIHNTLLRHRARKIVHVDALAASIASVIAMAGDEIHIAQNAFVMIHNPYGVAMGGSADFRKMADSLDKIRGAILDTYVLRTGGKPEDISAMMDEETWLTAGEAVAKGFADKLSEPVQMAAFAGLDVSAFAKAPADLKAAAEAAKQAIPADAPDTDQTETNDAGKSHVAIAKAEARLRKRGLLTA